jgi:hypothetical protein
MPLKSDVIVDPSKFDRSKIDKETNEFNEKLIKIWKDGPRWYEVLQHSKFLPSYAIHQLTSTRRSAQQNIVN